jgi:hypothetical protein
MAFNITVTGRKTDAISQLRQQAGAQRPGQTSGTEAALLDEAVQKVESQVSQYAGDDDSVSITVHGNFSQQDRSLGISCTTGVSISKAAAAAPGAPAPAVGAGAPAPIPGTPAAPAGGVAAAPTPAAAPPLPGQPTR